MPLPLHTELQTLNRDSCEASFLVLLGKQQVGFKAGQGGWHPPSIAAALCPAT